MTTNQEINLRDYIAKLKKRAQADINHKGSPVTTFDGDICINEVGAALMKVAVDIESLIK